MRPLFLLLALQSLAVPVWAQTAADPAAQVLPAITVSVVETRSLRDIVLASGLVAPVEQIQVAPLIEGQPIEALLADVGDKVAVGQVLARLSSSTLDLQKAQLAASLAAAKAQIAQSEAQLLETQSSAAEAQRVSDRTATLRKQGSASQAAADQAQAAAVSANARVAVATQSLEAARAQLALVDAQVANIDLQLARTEVKAPFAGEITARNAQLGAIASAAGQPMFSLIRDSALELRADIAESDLARLAVGQTASLMLVGQPEPLAGSIRLVEPAIDTTTRLGRVRISLADSALVRSGMFVEAAILVRAADVTAVPVTAVGSANGQATVMLVEAGKVQRQVVKTGIREGGWVEITEGLAPGQTIVTKAGAFVRDGEMINPIPAAPAAATN